MEADVEVWEGTVAAIYIGPEAKEPMVSVDEVKAIAGKGLQGDRYFNLQGTFSAKSHRPKQEVTLIESEAIRAAAVSYDIELDAAETRRNIVTEGTPLNHLVDREFVVGGVTMRGLKLCEPCSHLKKVTDKGILKPLIHRGGLRAQILTDGTIRVGDPTRGPADSVE